MNAFNRMKKTGDVLRRLRLSKDVNQSDIAGAMSIDATTYSKKENGNGDLNLGHICLAAAYYDMKPSEFVRLIEEPGLISKADLLEVQVEQLQQENRALKQKIKTLQAEYL